MSISSIQGNWTRSLEAAVAIASWARNDRLDPRDLDAYLYLTGIEELGADGVCPIANGDSVWWCYEGDDRIDPEQDWLSGEVVKCGRSEVSVRVERQLRDPKTNKPIQERTFAIAPEMIRQDD
jgi:hypothetical protein